MTQNNTQPKQTPKPHSHTLLEVCCGSFSDALTAYRGGADRIELNSALYLGGLTPSLGTLKLVKTHCPLPVEVMLRPRGGGFCYTEEELAVLEADAELLLEAGADGLVFGFLTAEGALDLSRTRRFTGLAHRWGREAVFHRAIDCTANPEKTAGALAELGVDRVLTSGGAPTAWEGRACIARLQAKYGEVLTILPGSGVRAENARALLEATGVSQLHSSCGGLRTDPTALGPAVSFGYRGKGEETSYEAVSEEKLRALREALRD